MKELQDYPGYFISEDGKVVDTQGEERPVYISGIPPYKYVNLPDAKAENNGGWQIKRVHILVAQAYVPNPDNLPMVDHEDRDKMNNHFSNLRWVTRAQNQGNMDRNIVDGGLKAWVRQRLPQDVELKVFNKYYSRMVRRLKANPLTPEIHWGECYP